MVTKEAEANRAAAVQEDKGDEANEEAVLPTLPLGSTAKGKCMSYLAAPPPMRTQQHEQ